MGGIMLTEKIMNIKFENLFVLYMFTRLYFYKRRHGAPIEARSLLPIVIGGILAVFKVLFGFSLWFIIIPFIAAILYAFEGYYKMKKGLIKADDQNIKYGPLLIELLIIFIISFAVATLLGWKFFVKGL
jgi:hypothetical protein